jgi:hypothetical protein
MDIGVYRQCLEQYVTEALERSDGTHAGIAEYLSSIKVSGPFVRNKVEKQTALREAINAFEHHRHWPLHIVLSHLGVDVKKSKPSP